MSEISIKLINGEAIEEMKKLENASVDLVICDLPYGLTQNQWDSIIPLEELFKEYKRVCKENAAIVLFGAMPFSADLVNAGREMFKYSLVWQKNKSTGHLNAKKRHMRQHEDLLVFCKKMNIYNPQKTQGHKPMNFAINERGSDEDKYSTNYGAVVPTSSNAGSTERYPSTLLDFPVVNNDDKSRIHPTQKPVLLLENLIKTFSNEGAVVLDNAMGSASTGIACLRLKRNFIGIELDREYFDKACKWVHEELSLNRDVE